MPKKPRATCSIAVCVVLGQINQNQRERPVPFRARIQPARRKNPTMFTVPGSSKGGRGEHYRGNTRDPTLRHSRGAAEGADADTHDDHRSGNEKRLIDLLPEESDRTGDANDRCCQDARDVVVAGTLRATTVIAQKPSAVPTNPL